MDSIWLNCCFYWLLRFQFFGCICDANPGIFVKIQSHFLNELIGFNVVRVFENGQKGKWRLLFPLFNWFQIRCNRIINRPQLSLNRLHKVLFRYAFLKALSFSISLRNKNKWCWGKRMSAGILEGHQNLKKTMVGYPETPYFWLISTWLSFHAFILPKTKRSLYL